LEDNEQHSHKGLPQIRDIIELRYELCDIVSKSTTNGNSFNEIIPGEKKELILLLKTQVIWMQNDPEEKNDET
jgi:hypothetical protein